MKNHILTEEMLTEFQRHLRLKERSKATVEKYMRDVRGLLQFACGQEMTRELLIEYKEHLRGQLADRSVNSVLAAINSLLTYLGWQELKLKSLRLQQTVFCPEERELTKEEYKRLCRVAEKKQNHRLNLILQTICGTGIRISELPFITVEAAKCGTASVNCKAKTRSVLIVQNLRKKLLKYAAAHHIESGAIFVTKNNRPINRTTVWREMKRLCEEAQVDPRKVYPHNLRHLFARVFYNLQKDIVRLADVLGHSSINTTRIYIISSGKEHLRHLEQMGLILQ